MVLCNFVPRMLDYDPRAVPLPRPLLGTKEPYFSFAGLKSAVLRARDAQIHRAEDIAASFQQAVVDCLIDRTQRAIDVADGATALVVAGGVAANQTIRAALEGLAQKNGMPFIAPPLWLCTDNAAMIGSAAWYRWRSDGPTSLDSGAFPNLRLPLLDSTWARGKN